MNKIIFFRRNLCEDVDGISAFNLQPTDTHILRNRLPPGVEGKSVYALPMTTDSIAAGWKFMCTGNEVDLAREDKTMLSIFCSRKRRVLF
jgi:hypothetical protein